MDKLVALISCLLILFISSGQHEASADEPALPEFTATSQYSYSGESIRISGIIPVKNISHFPGIVTSLEKPVSAGMPGMVDLKDLAGWIVNKYHLPDGRWGGQFNFPAIRGHFPGISCNSEFICGYNGSAMNLDADDRSVIFTPGSTNNGLLAPKIRLIGIELFNEPVPWERLMKNKDSSITLSNGITVSNIRFDGLSKWYKIPRNLSLAYDNNFLTFYYSGETPEPMQDMQYKYRMDGMEQNWSTVTKRTSATFGNLPPGKYTFRVMAKNGDGQWSNEYSYKFTIRPPWWKTNWAYFFYALMFFIGIIFIDRVQTRRVIARHREQNRDRELEQAKLIEKAYNELHIQNEFVQKQKEELEVQKKRSDELLLNILPSEVAEELKEKGTANAKLIEEVTVLFTDFKEFTLFSKKLSPQELVGEINECFSAFDHIMQHHGVEKIKTIGDAYMAVGGLPTPNTTHSYDVVNAALEIQQFMKDYNRIKAKAGKPFLEIRIGVHSGPVVAGIVGVKKFAYDIWGDTVNTAHHIESSSEAGLVNISGTTYRLVKDKFNCIHRGKIKAKHQGELDMYFVTGRIL